MYALTIKKDLPYQTPNLKIECYKVQNFFLRFMDWWKPNFSNTDVYESLSIREHKLVMILFSGAISLYIKYRNWPSKSYLPISGSSR